uniref:DnaJ homolog subfamily C member 9 n=1 Tax=Denticeps clupeoides TaxID=299321 RepID=A0AAY4CZK8_9TELE
MGLLERCMLLFNTSNLYEVLGLSKDASDSDLRRGYYKMSLLVHPDRAAGDTQATEKFQVLGKVYEVLKDQEQRSIYDEQGVVDEQSDNVKQERNWEDYWRLLFPKITLQDIVDFEKKYKGTEEEKQDLTRLYLQHAGDMGRIVESALFSEGDDEARIRGVIQGLIDDKQLPAYRAFTHESTKKRNHRKRKAEKERKEAEEMQKDLGVSSEESLSALIKVQLKTEDLLGTTAFRIYRCF